MRFLRSKTCWFALVLCVAVGFWFVSSLSHVTYENFRQVRCGMTEAEIDAIFREPGREDESLLKRAREEVPELGNGPIRYKVWLGPEICALVAFDADGKAELTAMLYHSDIRSASWVDWIRSLFRPNRTIRLDAAA